MSGTVYSPRYFALPDLIGLATHVEDVPMVDGDRGVFALAVRNDGAAATFTTANGDYSGIAVDSHGQVFVAFSAVAGGPVFAEDSPHTSGDLGFNILAVRRDVPINSANADGDYCEFNIDADGFLYIRSKAYDSASNADRVSEIAPIWSRRQGPTPLISVAQDFTAAWLALGPEIAVDGFTRASLWLNVDINATVNARVRCVGRYATGGSDFELPIYNPSVAGAASTYVVLVEGEAMELNDDIDQKLCLTWDIANTIPFIQFQIYAAAPGVPAGQILVADTQVTYGWGS